MKLPILGNHPASQADPFIVEDGDFYYIITSGTEYEDGVGYGIPYYRSSSLFGPYEYRGILFSLPGEKEYWAPSLIKIGEEYFLYFSSMHQEEEDPHRQTMKVAKAKAIEGPYELANGHLLPPFSIDSHPWVDGKGRAYLFYGANDYEDEKAGTRVQLIRLKTPSEAFEEPKTVIYPSHKEEIFAKDRFRKGQDWYTLEGPCYFEEGDHGYLLYSGNNFLSPDYFVGYAVTEKPLDLMEADFRKVLDGDRPYRLLFRDEKESGTGHNSVVKHHGEWYIIYHGRDPSDSHRTMRIAKLRIEKERLWVEKL